MPLFENSLMKSHNKVMDSYIYISNDSQQEWMRNLSTKSIATMTRTNISMYGPVTTAMTIMTAMTMTIKVVKLLLQCIKWMECHHEMTKERMIALPKSFNTWKIWQKQHLSKQKNHKSIALSNILENLGISQTQSQATGGRIFDIGRFTKSHGRTWTHDYSWDSFCSLHLNTPMDWSSNSYCQRLTLPKESIVGIPSTWPMWHVSSQRQSQNHLKCNYPYKRCHRHCYQLK